MGATSISVTGVGLVLRHRGSSAAAAPWPGGRRTFFQAAQDFVDSIWCVIVRRYSFKPVPGAVGGLWGDLGVTGDETRPGPGI
ncbi:hypothetical protein AWC14_05225 [Mycobacterium kyorinense]|uniref:Uncharacterized protein n=1 Tax=Mycobacterium kyorinense TaxID=487514 RepID=A0A1X1XWZ2_9MYCO|nr:hypothetical protein AWC14_05225 [Mycobacterium kyorinense]